MNVQQPDQQPGSADAKKGARLSAGAVASGIGVIALIVFMAQNTDDVKVSFLAWDFTWPLWLVTLVSAAVGALVWIGVGILRRHRRRKERRQARRA